jgi:hypothetical protein
MRIKNETKIKLITGLFKEIWTIVELNIKRAFTYVEFLAVAWCELSS